MASGDTAWTSLKTSNAPSPRQLHGAVHCGNLMYTFGGFDGRAVQDFQVLNLDDLTWAPVRSSTPPPSARHSHMMVHYGGSIFVFGGRGAGHEMLNDLHEFVIASNSWREIRPATAIAPAGRDGAAGAVCGSDLFVFGGLTSEGCERDVWKFSFMTLQWSRVMGINGKLPEPRQYHTANVVDCGPGVGMALVLCGGVSGADLYNDIVALRLDPLEWIHMSPVSPTGMAARRGHSTTVVGSKLYIFGGGSPGPSNDLWTFDVLTRAWTNVAAAGTVIPRSFHSAVIRGFKIFTFGGFSDHNLDCVDMLSVPPPIVSITESLSDSRSDLNSTPTPKLKLKCVYNGEIRVMPIPREIHFDELHTMLAKTYGVHVVMEYEDGDGDKIVIRSQGDLSEMFSTLPASNQAVKLFLTPAVDTPVASGAVPTTHSPYDAMMPPTPTSLSGSGSMPSISPSAGAGTVQHTPGGAAGSMGSLPRAFSTVSGPGAALPARRPLDMQPKIRWQKGSLLGAGGFGKVYLGLNSDSGEMMAVKQIVLEDKGAQEELTEVEQEIHVLSSLSHKHIVRYIATERSVNTDSQQVLNIFLEYVPGGSLSQLLHKVGSMTENVTRIYTHQILLGLDYLHEHRIVHRDIKGANILIASGEQTVIKLTDFGASKPLGDMQTMAGELHSFKGTPYYMAPEVVKQVGHGRKADVWSVGCTVIELLTGKPPWCDLNPVTALFRIASSTEIPAAPPGMSGAGQDFLRQCFQRDPNLRPTADELLRHEWLRDLNTSIPAAPGAPAMPPGGDVPSFRSTAGGVPSYAGGPPTTGAYPLPDLSTGMSAMSLRGGGFVSAHPGGAPPAAGPGGYYGAGAPPPSPFAGGPSIGSVPSGYGGPFASTASSPFAGGSTISGGFPAGGFPGAGGFAGGGGGASAYAPIDSAYGSLGPADELTPEMFWRRFIGEAESTPFSRFLDCLRSHLGHNFGPDDRVEMLRETLDYPGKGTVTRQSFINFLHWFGPLSECTKRMAALSAERWFHGMLDRDMTLRVLNKEPPGTFIVRLSDTTPGGFVVAFVDSAGQIVQSKIYHHEQGYTADNGGTFYKSVQELVAAYAGRLKIPKPKFSDMGGYQRMGF